MEQIRIIKASKAFGVRQIFKDISFDVKRGQRVGLVGPNGVGKSTLLKCIMGEETLDDGTIFLSYGASIGYLQQDVNLGNASLREEIRSSWEDVLLLEKRFNELTKKLETAAATASDLKQLSIMQERLERLGGYDYEAQSKRIVFGLGFTEADLDTRADAFSGGQKTRINVAKALVRQPDFLLLDEPTNHLDVAMLEWLESYLSSYGGGILMVSHDRYFLDRVATSIVELNHEKVTVYKGNYSRYMTQKEAQEKAALKAYEKQQEHIRATEAYIDKYRAGIKSKMARGRQSQLNRLERLDAPESSASLQFIFPKPAPCADKVLVMHEVEAGYGDKKILHDLDVVIRQGESVALIGPNGAGKSTLVKAIMGDLPYMTGQIDVGNRVQMGYFSQEHDELHLTWTLLEEVMHHSALTEGQGRNVLGRFLFRGDAVFQLVGELSGGERARLALLKLFLEGNNFLILDEPTNHLDIPTREVVEDALLAFGGTYLVISHDRYFLDKIASRTLSLEDGKVTDYLGNYSYYKEKVAEKEFLQRADVEEQKVVRNHKTESSRTADVKKVEKETPKPNEFMREKKVAQLEMDIARLEATVKMYTIQLGKEELQLDMAAYHEVSEALDKASSELNKAYEEWEQMMES